MLSLFSAASAYAAFSPAVSPRVAMMARVSPVNMAAPDEFTLAVLGDLHVRLRSTHMPFAWTLSPNSRQTFGPHSRCLGHSSGHASRPLLSRVGGASRILTA